VVKFLPIKAKTLEHKAVLDTDRRTNRTALCSNFYGFLIHEIIKLMCFVMWTGWCVIVVWAVTFVHVETVISIVNSSAFEDYCHVWWATTRLVEIYRYVWGKSVNFHEATPLSLVTRPDTVYSLPSLQQMPFYLYISPKNIT
jgi:hypothetical protein